MRKRTNPPDAETGNKESIPNWFFWMMIAGVCIFLLIITYVVLVYSWKWNFDREVKKG